MDGYVSILLPIGVAVHMRNYMRENSDVTRHYGDDNPTKDFELMLAALEYATKEAE